MRFRHVITCLVLVLIVAGCAGTDQSVKDSVLYHRLGFNKGIYALVSDFVDSASQDARIKPHFQGADLSQLKTLFTEQVCQISGGPCVESNSDLEKECQKLKATNEIFDALVEDMVASLSKFQISYNDQNTVLSVLASMRKDIVQKQ